MSFVILINYSSFRENKCLTIPASSLKKTHSDFQAPEARQKTTGTKFKNKLLLSKKETLYF